MRILLWQRQHIALLHGDSGSDLIGELEGSTSVLAGHERGATARHGAREVEELTLQRFFGGDG
jgi:hypothetical protein